MNAMNTVSTQAKRIAGIAAVVGTMFTFGGTMFLAEHYSTSSLEGLDDLAVTFQVAPAVFKNSDQLSA